jgi:hypothetical protein
MSKERDVHVRLTAHTKQVERALRRAKRRVRWLRWRIRFNTRRLR